MFEVFRANNRRVQEGLDCIFHTSSDGRLTLYETTHPNPPPEQVRAATEEAEKFLQRERAKQEDFPGQ